MGTPRAGVPGSGRAPGGQEDGRTEHGELEWGFATGVARFLNGLATYSLRSHGKSWVKNECPKTTAQFYSAANDAKPIEDQLY